MMFLANIRVENQKNIPHEELINKISSNINNFISTWENVVDKEMLDKVYMDYGYLIYQIEKHISKNKVYYKEYLFLLLYVVLQKEINNQPVNIFHDRDGIFQYIKDRMTSDYNSANDVFHIFKQQYGLELNVEDKILFIIILNQIRNMRIEKYMVLAIGANEDSTESKIIPLVKRLTRAENIESVNTIDCNSFIDIANRINEKVSYPYIGSIIYISPQMGIKLVQQELEKTIEKPFNIINSNLTTSRAILAIDKTNQISENNNLENIANKLKNVDNKIIKQGSYKKSIDIFIASFHETEPILSKIISNFDSIKLTIGLMDDSEVNIKVLTISRMNVLGLCKKLNTNILVLDLIGIKELVEGIRYFEFYKVFLRDLNLIENNRKSDDLDMHNINKVLENIDEKLLDSVLTLINADKGKEIFIEFIKYLEKSNLSLNFSNKIEKLYINFLLMLERCYAGIPIDKHPYENSLEFNKSGIDTIEDALEYITDIYPFKYSKGELIQLISIILR